jgi:hypothetical protein
VPKGTDKTWVEKLYDKGYLDLDSSEGENINVERRGSETEESDW